VDGDRVLAVTAGAPAPAPEASAQGGGGSAEGGFDEDAEPDMEKLMAEISSKLARADQALRAKAAAEERAKTQAEAVLSVFKAVAKAKEPEEAILAISQAACKMLNAEVVTMYYVHEQMQTPKQLRVARAVTAGGASTDREQNLHAPTLSCDLADAFVGLVSQDKVANKTHRHVCVERPSGGALRVVAGPPALQQELESRFQQAMQSTLALTGTEVPDGFSVTGVLTMAVTYTAPSKNMVTLKTDEELEEMFREVDADGGGSLDREEIADLGKRLGKRLTTKELDEAMKGE
jgi:hypothetical protein